jgi:hypothetical protein
MCEPISATTLITAASIGLSAAGAAYSVSQQSAAAKAQANANAVSQNAQNTAFWSRNADQRQQLEAEGAAQGQAQQQTQEAFQSTRARQQEALTERQDTLAQENQRAADIQGSADKAQQLLLGQTTGTAQTDAQTADVAKREAAIAPIAQNIQTASPLGNPSDGSTTRQAFAGELARAADAVRTYGKRAAQVASYTAPLNTVQQAATENATNLMPVAAANQLLQGGQGIRLLPSQQNYALAGTEGEANQKKIGAQLEGSLNVAKGQFQGSESVTNLQQADTTTLAQNQATEAASKAKVGQSIGALISSAGNLGAYASGRYGSDINAFFGPDVAAMPATSTNPLAITRTSTNNAFVPIR